jgi:hypothetical protein
MVTMAALAVMTTATATQTRLDNKTLLSLEISRLLTFIEADIRRAALCYQCGTASPYVFRNGDDAHIVLIDEDPEQSDGQCLRFAYQQGRTHPTQTMDKDDAKGFRFDAESQAIEAYENHRDTANWSCESGYWRDISSRALKVSDLSFSRNEKRTESGRLITSLTIQLSASLKRQPSERETLSRTLVFANTVVSS